MNFENHKVLMEWIRRNRFLRRKLAAVSHSMFFVIYFHRYMKHKTAPFQREIFKLTEKKGLKMCVISAFRGSAKSTICSMSFPIWAMITGQAHYVVIASQTQKQARQILKHIRDEFESNALLKNDFGPFETESDQWGAYALNFKFYDARMQAVSLGESIRGSRHKHYRPDLIILDDIEDLDSTRTKEARDKSWQWFTSEIVPLGMLDTRIMVLGNFLHDLSLVGRIIAQMQLGARDGEWRRFPLLEENDKPVWPGMFPDMDTVEELRRAVGDEVAWKREYLLEIIPDDWQIIHQEWIRFYDALPEEKPHTIFISADLAISEKESADCTAIVTAYAYNYGQGIEVYFMEDPINRRMNHPDTLEAIKDLYRQHKEICSNVQILIEDVGYQRAVIQDLEQIGYVVKGVVPKTDKRARLMSVSNFFQAGAVFLPRYRANDLYVQLTGFGRERYDDLADATTMILTSIIFDRPVIQKIFSVELWPRITGVRSLIGDGSRMDISFSEAARRRIDNDGGPTPAPVPKNNPQSSGPVPNSLTALTPSRSSYSSGGSLGGSRSSSSDSGNGSSGSRPSSSGGGIHGILGRSSHIRR